MTLTLRKYDMSGFKGTITLSAKAGDSLTVKVADHVPAGNDLKRLAIRNQHTDLPGTRVAFTNTGAVTITAPAKDTVYDAFFSPQIDTTIYFRGLRFFGGGAPINYGCLDPSESKLTARPTVAGVYTVGMTPPLASVELRGGAEPIVSAAVKRLNDAWRVFPDFAVHRIDLDLNARNAPFMMGLGTTYDFYGIPALRAPDFVLIDPESAGRYDLVERMVTETFHGLFFGVAGGPCVTTLELLNPEDQATAEISDVGKMVLYYFALR